MVLVFCRVLIVPYLLTEDYVSTHCVISSIQVLEDTSNITCGRISEVDTQILDENFTYCVVSPHVTSETNMGIESANDEEKSGLCVHVKVSYRAFDGLVHKATLQALPRNFDDIARERITSERVSNSMIDQI